MPRLWSATIDAHRREVRDAILETTAALVVERGLRDVTMSQIADETGIGRATLYKYFPGVEAIVVAWHERQVAAHLDYLADVGSQTRGDGERLEAVLEAYALILHEHPHAPLAAWLHRQEHVARAQREVHRYVRRLVSEGAAAGKVRDDIAADELASYCLHALSAASTLRSKPAVRRLVRVTLAGLRPPPTD